MKRLKTLWNRWRAWRLTRLANDLQREADYHRHAAKMHADNASQFWQKSNDVRTLARRVKAARL